MTYPASLDKMAKGITIAVSLLFAFIILLQFSLITQTARLLPDLASFLLLLIYGTLYLFRPIHYQLNKEGLIIHRMVADVKIKRSQIENVALIDEEMISGSIRTFGVGGLFGYYGKFANRKIGSMTWYATRRDKLVLISTTNKKKILLTPNNPDLFVADYNSFV